VVVVVAISCVCAALAGTAHAAVQRGARAPSTVQIAASARTPLAVRPLITSLKVSGPRPLPAGGAAVTVTVTVKRAVACTFLRQKITFSSLYPFKTVSCASGGASVIVPAIENINKVGVHLTYAVRVIGAGGLAAERSVTVPQAGATHPPPSPPPPPPAPPRRISTNRSGYVIPSTSPVTDADGEFTVPTLNCQATPNAGVSVWTGIGGDPPNQRSSDGTLLQTGIAADCVNGVQNDVGWWEEAPQYYETDFHNFPVSPGDTIKASVWQAPNGSWWTRLDDLTTGLSGWMGIGQGWGVGVDTATSFAGQGSTAAVTYGGGYTAEWIVEAYGFSDGSQVTLADYGSITFSNLGVAGPPSWALLPNEQMAMQPFGASSPISTPSQDDDDSFTVTYLG
jgi:hypothetical protein